MRHEHRATDIPRDMDSALYELSPPLRRLALVDMKAQLVTVLQQEG